MRPSRLLVLAAAVLLAAACGTPEAASDHASTPTPSRTQPQTAPTSPSAPATTPTRAAPLGTVPPPWLGTRVLATNADGYVSARPTPPALRNRRFTLPDQLAALPGSGFASRVAAPAPARVIARSTWQPACPVAADDLAWVRLTFRGFDGERHTGELLVNRSAADDVVAVFRRLWRADFPVEQMHVTSRAELDAAPTGDGNNTSAFVCRPVTGGSSYSVHAYGLAIDVDPFQNPYVKGDRVIPELATSYVDRSRCRPGMIEPGGPVTSAFASVGWVWGGTYRSLKDLQHFSANGR
ncbi:M15 family metallopeptidase [Marmoricola endophyticus]|uniref:M15 family metallopeptidase n=1 Tax=Marmoricola endophyticus TaxID=2040280 RepID=UPI0016671503|nr:M15 family metallopeptidase [Marmoricola endophyticus]